MAWNGVYAGQYARRVPGKSAGTAMWAHPRRPHIERAETAKQPSSSFRLARASQGLPAGLTARHQQWPRMGCCTSLMLLVSQGSLSSVGRGAGVQQRRNAGASTSGSAALGPFAGVHAPHALRGSQRQYRATEEVPGLGFREGGPALGGRCLTARLQLPLAACSINPTRTALRSLCSLDTDRYTLLPIMAIGKLQSCSWTGALPWTPLLRYA